MSDPNQVRVRVAFTSAVIALVGLLTFGWLLSLMGPWRLSATISLMLYAILFGWISLCFAIAMEGFYATLSGRCCSKRRESDVEVTEVDASCVLPTTAILMPIYNESPRRVMAAIAAMREQLLVTPGANPESIDFFVLSDSTDPEIWLHEEWCWTQLMQAIGGNRHEQSIRVFYRHRRENRARKSGNIEDFCEKWGSQYECMIVLDADSMMSGATIVEMIRRMASDESIGILQVPPVPIGRESLFARYQQFAAAVYGPMFNAGLDAVAAAQGNYWGHNAIIRIAPFMRHCRLPVLPGREPLGGEILSHDFVEAALLVRAGWKVVMAHDLRGSYEECPTTVMDHVKRDHRWCQGNLQHWRLLLAKGMHPMSRFHFASGMMSYLSSPIWMLFLASCVLGSRHDADITSPTRMVHWVTAIGLFAFSMLLLILPKLAATSLVLANRTDRNRLGGGIRIVASVILESWISFVFAPINAYFQIRSVIAILCGQKVAWNAQQRDDQGVSWRESAFQFSIMSGLGFFIAMTLYLWRPTLLFWFAPVWMPWAISIAAGVAFGSQRVGRALKSCGLLTIVQERSDEPVVVRHRHWLRALDSKPDTSKGTWFDWLWRDTAFRQQHLAILRSAEQQASRGTFPAPIVPSNIDGNELIATSPTARRRLLSDDQTIEAMAAAS
ncbi:MAG: glucans biosynthesis glucosyltransferase MdoH [Planctomycetota bacterium]